MGDLQGTPLTFPTAPSPTTTPTRAPEIDDRDVWMIDTESEIRDRTDVRDTIKG